MNPAICARGVFRSQSSRHSFSVQDAQYVAPSFIPQGKNEAYMAAGLQKMQEKQWVSGIRIDKLRFITIVITGNVRYRKKKRYSGEAILHKLDLAGISISTGSACNSLNTEISHVSRASRLDSEYAKGTVRISLGKHNTADDVERIVPALASISWLSF